MTDLSDLIERLRAACVGHPSASIAWPHRILHEAADALSSQSLSLSEAREEIERLKGLVAGIRECLQEPWQDIATAPKDGTFVDLWAVREATGEADRYADCVWARTVWGGEPIGEPRWQGLHDRFSVVTPTHWMPLAGAPKSALENSHE